MGNGESGGGGDKEGKEGAGALGNEPALLLSQERKRGVRM